MSNLLSVDVAKDGLLPDEKQSSFGKSVTNPVACTHVHVSGHAGRGAALEKKNNYRALVFL